MADLSDDGNAKSKKIKSRAQKRLIKIDMTPMVDLAFLLLTFFILTTTLSEQKNLEILLPPVDEPGDPVNNAVTIILSGNDKLFYYTGKLKTETRFTASNVKNIREVITRQNDTVYNNLLAFEQKYSRAAIEADTNVKNLRKKILDDGRGAYVIIKYDHKAKYRNAIDLFDEMDICGIPPGKYSVINKLDALEEKKLEEVSK